MESTKDKLANLIHKAKLSMWGRIGLSNEKAQNNYIADYLIANGVVLPKKKSIEGLKTKYLVFKADTGEVIENCFVLCPGKDHAAVEALRAYAKATNNKILAEDIYNWVGKGENDVEVDFWTHVIL